MTSNPAIIPFDGQKVTPAQRFILEAIETHWRGHMQPPTVRELSDATGIDYRMVHYHVSTLRKMGLITMEPGKNRTLRTARMMVSTVLYKREPYSALFWGDGGYTMKELLPMVEERAGSVQEEPAKVGKKS